jgi:uncharacterized protein YlbG (UPF0298 family)
MTYRNRPYSAKPKVVKRANYLKEIIQCNADFWDCIIERIKSTAFVGKVELIVPPPIDQDFSLRLHRLVKSIPQVESVDIRRSDDNEIVFYLQLGEPTLLLRKLTEIADIRIRFQSRNKSIIRRAESSGTTAPST